jgi:hypothetical protein
MKHRTIALGALVAVACGLVAFAPTVAAQTVPSPIAIVGGTLIDGVSRAATPNAVVLIRAGRI